MLWHKFFTVAKLNYNQTIRNYKRDDMEIVKLS